MHLVWLLSLVALTYGLDPTKLWKQPPPMKGFNIMPFLGRWFVQYRKAPCGWEGSAKFTDFETYMTQSDKNVILVKETSRNKICNSAKSLLYLGKQPGVLIAEDPMGDKWSGSYVVVATDYKTWSITYGCSKLSVFGDKCEDPWLSIKTRMPYPSQHVLAQINKTMMKLWGATLNELQRVQHGQSCAGAGGKQG